MPKMPKIFVIGDGNIELLKQFVDNATEPDFSDFSAESEELLEDEDLPLVVQVRVEDETELSPGHAMKKWVDTNINADDLEEYRVRYPEQEYRLVAVYDEIVTVDESVEQEVEFLTAEDEIDSLKEEIVQLKALVANYENVTYGSQAD